MEGEEVRATGGVGQISNLPKAPPQTRSTGRLKTCPPAPTITPTQNSPDEPMTAIGR